MPLRRRPDPFHKGTHLKTFFTNSARRRYGPILMVLLFAAAVASAPPQAPPGVPPEARAEARATIRIILGVQLHFGEGRAIEGLAPRDTIIHSAGAEQPAKLIEFQ